KHRSSFHHGQEPCSPTKAVYICADQPVTIIYRLRQGGGPYIPVLVFQLFQPLIPCCRHNSAVVNPASPCFRMAMICSSLCRVPFMPVLLSWVWENSHSRRSSFRGLRQFSVAFGLRTLTDTSQTLRLTHLLN